MAQCAVIADDLTGANATGVLLTKMHYKTATVLSLDNLTPDLLAAADCVLYPTDSRAIAADLAYERVRRAMDRFAGKDIRLFSKRIDSTLRGNLGPETDAMLDALGKDSVAVCAPCFPSAGRVVAAVLKAPSSVHLCCVTGDGLYPENRIDFTPYMERYQCSLDAASGMINDAFAEITWRILQKDSSFSGIYTSGGDVTQAVCRWFRAAGLDLHGEVLPLAAYGRFMGGDFNGLPIVTKGGSQGGPDAINQCINYLRERLRI